MNIGIIGLSGSGKTALFSSLIGDAGAGRTGVVKVPDNRLDLFSGMYKPKKTVNATIVFEDCFPLDTPVKQDRVKLYEALRKKDALVAVIGLHRCVSAEDAVKEFKQVRFELIMNDLDFVTKRIERIEQEIRVVAKDRQEKEKNLTLMKRLQPILEEEKMLRGLEFDESETEMMNNANLLTVKSMAYLINYPEGYDNSEMASLKNRFESILKETGEDSPILDVNALLESEISSMPDEDALEFMKEYGIKETGKDRIIREAYRLADLITFFTVGEDECRSWPLKDGGTALDSAGVIHTDLARGFIRAEVVAGKDLLELGSLNEARKVGKLRLEGKTYRVKDGDVVHIMFNV